MKKIFPLFSLLTIFILSHQFAFAQEGEIKGVHLRGSKGITETVAKIMAREAALRKKRLSLEESEDLEPIYPDRRHLPQNPLSPAAARFPDLRARGTGQPLAAQSLGTSFTGASRNGDTISAVPPDNMGAVGPTQYIVIVNGKIKSFNKSTGVPDGALNTSDAIFWTSVRNGVGVSDPRIRYDRKTQRWFVVEINVANTLNRIMIAVSSGPTITGTGSFTFFTFACPSGFDDYPTLGIDDNALYIGTNNFTSSVGSFSKTNGYVINKANLIAGTLTVTSFQGLGTTVVTGPYTPQGVDNFDNAPTFGYFIGTDLFTFGKLQIRRVSNAGSASPTISGNISLTVSTFVAPLGGVPFQGATSGRTLSDVDERLFAAVIRNNHIWTAHCVQVNASGVANSTGGRDGGRWYEIDVSSATPSVVQSGTIFDPAATNPASYFFPTVSVSGQGHAAFSLSSSGAAAFTNTSTAGRLASDGAGTTGSVVNITASSTSYNLEGSNSKQRWGDYSFVSVDPLDDMTMWMINEFCNATNSWGSRVTKLIAPPPATPAGCSPASVASGQSSVNVTVTGTSSSGSGFFDPGANLAGAIPFSHIAASVSGSGVTVNSIAFTDPTHITLNLNTTGASPGTRTISVTNPDGQTIASPSAILTIISSLDAAPTNNGPICPNGTLNLSANPTGGTQPYSFSWTGPAGFTSTQQNPSITNAAAANSGTYSVTVTDNNGAGNSIVKTTAAVIKTPPSASISPVSPQAVCASDTPFTLSAITDGASPSFLWKKAGSAIAPAQTNSTLSVSQGGSYSVVITSNSCSSESAPFVLTVKPLPVVSFSTLAPVYNISASAVSLTGSPTGGTFAGPGISGNTFTPSAAGVGGPYTITYTFTDSNGCSNNSSQQTSVANCPVTATPGAITSIGGVQAMCPGQSKSYSITAVTGAISYTWTPPAGANITAGQGTRQVTVLYTASFTASGALKVVANNNCGFSAVRSLTIARNTPLTPGVITGIAAGVCQSSGVPYSVTNVAGRTYNWTFSTPNSATVATGQGSNAITANFSPAFTTGKLSITAGNACGTSAARTLVIKAAPATPSAISGVSTVCTGQQAVPYSIQAVPNVLSYTWMAPTGCTISDSITTSAGRTLSTTATSVKVNFASTSGNLTVKAVNSCGAGATKALAISVGCTVSKAAQQEALSNKLHVVLTPNPTSNAFVIRVYGSTSQPVYVKAVDANARIVYEAKGAAERSFVFGENLSAGLYIVEVKQGDETQTIKAIKEK